MIKGFEVGKKYRFIGDKASVEGWATNMKALLDGLPRRCNAASYDGLRQNQDGMAASFDGVETNDGRCWDFSGDQANFEEVAE